MRAWNDYKQTARIQNPLFNWAREGQLPELGALVLNVESVNIKDEKGYSPLMLAAYHGHDSVCETLLQQGADVNSVDLSGSSILMGASFKGHFEVVKILVQWGADIHYRNARGQTALDFAQMFGRGEVAKYLKKEQNQAAVFSVLDIIKGWSSIFNFKGERK
ncbi:MAG: ankyrin repeat domain-containing protein [Bdellovibrio sp.]|nr:ankyrin repeat domain-containing protein [Bdellovibrio sp.]